MRYKTWHKQETREQIVRAASRRFRGAGGRGVAIADLMKELRLTHGGFYRHFKNKEELFEEALKKAFDDAAVRLIHSAEQAPKGGELKAIIEMYLSDDHCQHPSEGCPVAAMAADMARHPKAVRMAFGRALNNGVLRMARFVPGKTEKERHRRALALFSGMAGALSLARAVKDEVLRNTILQSARESYIEAFCPG